VRKTANQLLNNSSTLTNDTELKVVMGANEVWEFEAFVVASLASGDNANDVKYSFNAPTGASIRWASSYQVDGSTSVANLSASTALGATGQKVADISNNNTVLIRIRGFVQTAGTGGDLQFQWANNNATSTPELTVQAGSFIKAGKF